MQSKKLIIMHIVDADLSADIPFTVNESVLFAGSLTDDQRLAVKKNQRSVLTKTYDKSQLLELQPFTGGEESRLADDALLDDLFDITELHETVKPAPSAPSADASIPPRHKSAQISTISVYPEDRVSELKEKIFLQTNIPPYKQYLYIKFNGNFIPLYYRIIANGMINVDIQKAIGIATKILGVPVDTNFFNDKKEVLIEAGDMFFTVGDVENTFNTQTFYVISIDSVIGSLKRVLDEMTRTDPDQVELMYYGFVVKYWPMLTYDIFLQYLSDEKSIPKNYPDMAPSRSSLQSRMESEQKVLNQKYNIINNKNINNFSPQVANFDPPTANSVVDTAIKSATIIVKEKSWNSKRVGLEFAGRTKMNIKNLFYHMHVDNTVPIIRARFIISNQLITITKIQSPTRGSTAQSDIRTIYDQMRARLFLPYFNAIMFVVKTSNLQYVTVTIRDNGYYEIRSIWNEDDKMNFKVLVNKISESVNPLITKINNMGRAVFQGGMQLSMIHPSTVSFSDLNMALFWKKTISSTDFQVIKDQLQKRLASEIIKFTESPNAIPDLVQYVLIKGMTQEKFIRYT